MRNFKNIRDSISLQKEKNENINFKTSPKTVNKYHSLPYIPTGSISRVLNTKEQIRRAQIELQRNKFNKKI